MTGPASARDWGRKARIGSAGDRGRFFEEHPEAFAVSMLGAAVGAVVFARRARRARSGLQRLLWTALALSQVAQLVGIARTRIAAGRL